MKMYLVQGEKHTVCLYRGITAFRSTVLGQPTLYRQKLQTLVLVLLSGWHRHATEKNISGGQKGEKVVRSRASNTYVGVYHHLVKDDMDGAAASR